MIRFFVSSTFRDMHDERDRMHQYVLPEVNKAAFEFGETVELRDLRWGVTTSDAGSEEEANRKVLMMCLEEIDECRPYMIVLLGDRYGYCPDQENIREVIRERNERMAADAKHTPFPQGDEDISVTELEIRYGALYPPDKESLHKVLFYKRELRGRDIPKEYLPENEEAGKKQQELIRSIKEKCSGDEAGFSFKPYRARWDGCAVTDLTSFQDQLVRDIRKVLNDEKKKTDSLSEWKKEFLIHNKYAESRRQNFFGRGDVISEIQNRLETGDQYLVAVSADPGLGKTSLMSQLQKSLKDSQTQTEAMILFCGYTPATCRALDLVRGMLAFLNEQLSECEEGPAEEFSEPDPESADLEQWRTALEERFERYREIQKSVPADRQKKLVILLDALDQLDEDDGRRNLAFLPGNVSEWTRIVISYVPTFDSKLDPDRTVTLLPFDKDADKKKVLEGLLRAEGKELAVPVLSQIEKKKDSNSPLYLSLIAQRLDKLRKPDFDRIEREAAASGDREQAVADCQTEIIDSCPDDLPGLCRELLRDGLRTDGKDENPVISEALRLISVSRFGLREQDLEGIFKDPDEKWNSLNFFQFFWYLRSLFLVRDDGRIDFSHKSIREGYRQGRTKAEDKKDHRRIFLYLRDMKDPDQDPVRNSEIFYHCWHADEKKWITGFLAEYPGSEKPEIYKTAAREILRMSLDVYYQQGPEAETWFEKVLKKLDPWARKKDTLGVLAFLFRCLGPAAGSSKPELAVLERLFRQGLDLAQKIYDDSPGDQERAVLITACSQLGRSYYRMGDRRLFSLSLHYYRRGQTLAEEAGSGGGQTQEQKRDMYLAFGDIYSAMGGAENRNTALRYYLKAEDLEGLIRSQEPSDNRENEAWTDWSIRIKIADTLAGGNQEDRDRAISGYRGLEEDIRKSMPGDGSEISGGSTRSVRMLILILVRLGDALMQVYGCRCAEAAEKYREAAKLAGQIERRTRSGGDRARQILCRERQLFAGYMSACAEEESGTKDGTPDRAEKIRADFRRILEEPESAPEQKTGSLLPGRFRISLLDHEGTALMNRGFYREAEESFREALDLLNAGGNPARDEIMSEAGRDQMVLLVKLDTVCKMKNRQQDFSLLDEAYHLAEERYKYWATADCYMDLQAAGNRLMQEYGLAGRGPGMTETARKHEELALSRPDYAGPAQEARNRTFYCWPAAFAED